MNELVSVIMPTYNRGYIIKMAIDSILNQTYKNIEFIIVDDCSTDNTDEIINSYADDRIKYVKLEKNSGANFARNTGLSMASGEYITFQDSDDYSFPERIEKEVNYLKETNSDVVFCSFNRVKNNKRKVEPKKQILENNIHGMLLTKNFITTQVILGKKEVFEKVKFDNELPRFQDWDLAIRISSIYKISHLNESLLDLYVQNDSITKNPKKGSDALTIIFNKYESELNDKQKCRLLFRRGVFKMLSDMDATSDFKEGLKYYKNLEYIAMYSLYKLKLLKLVYKLLKK